MRWNLPPQHMSLWHKDYIELKKAEKQQVPEQYSNIPFLPEIGR